MALRVVAGVIGGLFLSIGLNWLFDPREAAEGLRSALQEGTARSTQIGDTASFFLCMGGFALYGAYRRAANWLRASACLLGGAALARLVAWAFHDAPFTTFFIGVELVTAALLTVAASKFESEPAAIPPTAS